MTVATGRDLSLELYRAAVDAVAPGPLTQAAVADLAIEKTRRVWIYSFGKAAHGMAHGAAAALRRDLVAVSGGVVVAPTHAPPPIGTVVSIVGDHPVPGRRSFAAAQRIAEIAVGRTGADVALVLVSGGTSSLIAGPLRGIPDSDVTRLYELLLASGLDVTEMNAVRKRFTRWGGGRLALALAPAAIRCLVISDVPGDDPGDVGSGPCVPDRFTSRDVAAIVERAQLGPALPPSVREYLAATSRGIIPDTPKCTHPAFAHAATRVIGNNRLALDGAAARARVEGYDWVDVAPQRIAGEAARCGASLARELIALRAQSGGSGHLCRIWGGETTVDMREVAGTPGGRCQELALAAARVLHEAGDDARGISILAAGSDGRDGTTDAAGALVDSHTWSRIAASGIDPAAALARHAAHPALDAVGALVRTGPTGTNVADVVVGTIL